MKKQGKNPPDQTNEEEVGSLPEKEFRVMIVKMIQNLVNRMEKIQDMLIQSMNKSISIFGKFEQNLRNWSKVLLSLHI